MWEPQWRSFADRYRLAARRPRRLRPDADRAAAADARAATCSRCSTSSGSRRPRSSAARWAGASRSSSRSRDPTSSRRSCSWTRASPASSGRRLCASSGPRRTRPSWRGDFDAAIEITLRMWVDGPRRQPSDVDPGVRAAVAEMQRRALELQAPYWEEGDEELLVPDVADRLGEVRAPTLVVVGEEDFDEMQAIGRKLAAEIPDARLETIPGAAHIPSLERPELFDPLVLGFLARRPLVDSAHGHRRAAGRDPRHRQDRRVAALGPALATAGASRRRSSSPAAGRSASTNWSSGTASSARSRIPRRSRARRSSSSRSSRRTSRRCSARSAGC